MQPSELISSFAQRLTLKNYDMDNDLNIAGETSEAKYKFVIEETTKEVNRVLTNWLNDSDLRRNFEVGSLFRSYLSKFLNAKFGWRHYAFYIKNFNPIPLIKDNKLVGISLSDSNYGNSLDINIRESFRTTINNFDFDGFNDNWVKENQHVVSPKKNWEVSNINDVSFDNIKNIKF